jgi:hypothetical protein
MRLSYAYLTIILFCKNLTAANDIECLPKDFNTPIWSNLPNEIKELIKTGHYQETILHLNPSTDQEQKRIIRELLENIMKNSPLSLEENHEWEIRGATKPKIVKLACNVKGILKVKKRHPSSNYRAEIGAYRIDRLLGFDFVPPTILRTIEISNKEKEASLQYFMSQAKHLDESYNKSTKLLVFDFILHNKDRNIGNVMIYNDSEIAIDHGLSLKKRNLLGHSLGITDTIKNMLFIKTDPIRNNNLNCKKADWSKIEQFKERFMEISKEDVRKSLSDLFSERKINYIYSRIEKIRNFL